MVAVAAVAVRWAYRQHHGYWLLYFGQHGPFAETCLFVLLAVMTLWMRWSLFEPREGLPESAFPRCEGSPRLHRHRRRVVRVRTSDRSSVTVLIVASSLAAVAVISAEIMDLGRAQTWMLLFAAVALGVVLIDRSIHNLASDGAVDAVGGASAVGPEELLQTRKGEFKSRTRCPRVRVPFWAVTTGCTVIYICTYQMGYRWEVPPAYYVGWTLPFSWMVAWCWEVLFSVVGSYRPQRLGKLDGMASLYWVYESLTEDTARLIWSIGTFSFFLTGFFGDFYVVQTKILYIPFIAAILLAALLPWSWVHGWAEPLVRDHINAREVDLARCLSFMYASDDGWKTEADEKTRLVTEIDGLKELLAKFDFSRWLNDRRSDLVPVTLINIAGPYITGPLLNFLHAISQ
jgi:hypothetical protein